MHAVTNPICGRGYQSREYQEQAHADMDSNGWPQTGRNKALVEDTESPCSSYLWRSAPRGNLSEWYRKLERRIAVPHFRAGRLTLMFGMGESLSKDGRSRSGNGTMMGERSWESLEKSRLKVWRIRLCKWSRKIPGSFCITTGCRV